MLISSQGIVLRTIKYSETSVIAKVYTREQGLTSLMINGVRKSKARHQISLLQPMSLLQVVFYYKPGKDLHRLKEMRGEHIFASVPFDVVKSSIAIFMAELCTKCIREEEENMDLFDFLWQQVLLLDQDEQSLQMHPQLFMLNLTVCLGFFPVGNYNEQRPYYRLVEASFVSEPGKRDDHLDLKRSKLFAHFIQTVRAGESYSYTKGQRTALLDILLLYYRAHVENFYGLNSVEVIREVFA